MPKIRVSLSIEPHPNFQFGIDMKVVSNATFDDQLDLPFFTIAPETDQSFLERLAAAQPPCASITEASKGCLRGIWCFETSPDFPDGALVRRWSVREDMP